MVYGGVVLRVMGYCSPDHRAAGRVTGIMGIE
jgi:hypothetical protein